jgi:hypothetical protein
MGKFSADQIQPSIDELNKQFVGISIAQRCELRGVVIRKI